MARPPFAAALIDVVVVDVLGTLVDEPTGIRAAIGAACAVEDETALDALTQTWLEHIAREHQRIVEGRIPTFRATYSTQWPLASSPSATP